jgi:hypothetical protein
LAAAFVAVVQAGDTESSGRTPVSEYPSLPLPYSNEPTTRCLELAT